MALAFQNLVFFLNPWLVIVYLYMSGFMKMTGRKIQALQVPPAVQHKALDSFSKALYGTTGGTCSAQCFRPVMVTKLLIIIT